MSAADTDSDPVARLASTVIGGPLGRYAAPRRLPWPIVAALLMVAAGVTTSLGVVLRAPCIRSGWDSPGQFWSMCFSDLATTYTSANLSSGIGPFLQGGALAPTPSQPPLTAVVMTFLASLTPDGAGRNPGDLMRYQLTVNFALWAVLATILVCAMVWWVASSIPTNPLRAAQVALSPVLALTLLVSPDIVGVALATAGIWAWGRSRPVAAGVLLGLACSARTYPVLILVAIGLLSLRAGRGVQFARTAASAIAVVSGILFFMLLVNPEAAYRAYRTWWESGASYGSPWFLPQLFDHPMDPSVTTWLTIGGWMLAVLIGAALALGAPRRPTVAEISLVMVAVVLVTGKSFTVQSSLWLVPLVALTSLPWRDHLIWAGAEVCHFGAVWLTIAGVSTPDRGLPDNWYAVFLLLRLSGVAWLAYRAWLTAYERWPEIPDFDQSALEHDHGEVDECAGVLAGAPDQRIVRLS